MHASSFLHNRGSHDPLSAGVLSVNTEESPGGRHASYSSGPRATIEGHSVPGYIHPEQYAILASRAAAFHGAPVHQSGAVHYHQHSAPVPSSRHHPHHANVENIANKKKSGLVKNAPSSLV